MCASAAAPQVKTNAKDQLIYVWISPGQYRMGWSPEDHDCFAWEKPAHAVVIHQGFWIGQTEVTRQAYVHVMGTNPSGLSQ
jgi:formylglycine-generating enzyme required for sulfatase activity